MRGDLRRRFDAKWTESTEHSHAGTYCWDWQASTNSQGYGRIGVREFEMWLTRYAHRVGYELYRGPIPDGLDCDHLCRRPQCVNPMHIEPVTHAENCQRGASGDLRIPRLRASRKRPYHLCVRGHTLWGSNLRVNSQGTRFCVQCGDDADSVYYWGKKVERLEAITARNLKQSNDLAYARVTLAALVAKRAEEKAAMTGVARYVSSTVAAPRQQ